MLACDQIKNIPITQSHCSTLVLRNAFKPAIAGLINNETLTGSVIFKSGMLVYGGNPDCHKYTHQL